MNKTIILITLALNTQLLAADVIYKSFTVSSDLYERYKTNYPKLNVGINKDEVIKLLGPPHNKTEIITKMGDNKGTEYQYYIRRIHPNLVNEKRDKYINIYFGIEGKLTYAYPHNLKEFVVIGAP